VTGGYQCVVVPRGLCCRPHGYKVGHVVLHLVASLKEHNVHSVQILAVELHIGDP
jgi:hypothetical protein